MTTTDKGDKRICATRKCHLFQFYLPFANYHVKIDWLLLKARLIGCLWPCLFPFLGRMMLDFCKCKLHGVVHFKRTRDPHDACTILIFEAMGKEGKRNPGNKRPWPCHCLWYELSWQMTGTPKAYGYLCLFLGNLTQISSLFPLWAYLPPSCKGGIVSPVFQTSVTPPSIFHTFSELSPPPTLDGCKNTK